MLAHTWSSAISSTLLGWLILLAYMTFRNLCPREASVCIPFLPSITCFFPDLGLVVCPAILIPSCIVVTDTKLFPLHSFQHVWTKTKRLLWDCFEHKFYWKLCGGVETLYFRIHIVDSSSDSSCYIFLLHIPVSLGWWPLTNTKRKWF